MPSIKINEAYVPILAADAKGNLTVTSNAAIFPGAKVWLAKDDGSAQKWVKVVLVSGTSSVVVQDYSESAPPDYGVADVAAFAAASHLCQEKQVVSIDPSYSKINNTDIVPTGVNLLGTASLADLNTTFTVIFPVAQPDALYKVMITPVVLALGAPVGSTRVAAIDKLAASFTVHLEAAPGAGLTNTFDWFVLR